MKAHTIKVSGIPEELLRQIDAIAESGGYAGRSEVVREALRDFTRRRQAQELEVWAQIRERAKVYTADVSTIDTSRD